MFLTLALEPCCLPTWLNLTSSHFGLGINSHQPSRDLHGGGLQQLEDFSFCDSIHRQSVSLLLVWLIVQQNVEASRQQERFWHETAPQIHITALTTTEQTNHIKIFHLPCSINMMVIAASTAQYRGFFMFSSLRLPSQQVTQWKFSKLSGPFVLLYSIQRWKSSDWEDHRRGDFGGTAGIRCQLPSCCVKVRDAVEIRLSCYAKTPGAFILK